MALTPRKDEWPEVADAIEKATPQGLEAAAKAALKASFTVLQKRHLWAVATDAQIVYGPWASETDAYNALAAGQVEGFVDEEGIKALRKEDKSAIPSLGGKALVLRLTGPLALAEQVEHHDRKARIVAEHLCSKCEHKKAVHGLNGRSTACSVTGCTCKAVPTHPII